MSHLLSCKLPHKLISWVSRNAKMPNCIVFFCSINHRGDSYGSTSTTSNISFQLGRTWSFCKYGFSILGVLFCFCGLFLSRCLMLRNTQRKKAEESSLSFPCPFSLLSCHVIFHVICFFINENVAKNNWLQTFENLSGKVLWWSSFSKVTSMQCSDSNFVIKRTHCRLFLEYVFKTSCFKRNILRKKSMVD